MDVSVHKLKPVVEGIVRPIVRLLARLGVIPNQVTLAALIGSVVVGGVIASFEAATYRVWLALPIWLFIRMLMNAIDGLLAREHEQETRLGGVLNEVTDVVADAVLYLPLALLPISFAWVAVAFVIVGVATEVVALAVGASGLERPHHGPLGKGDRALMVGTIGLALGLGATAGLWVPMVLALLTVLGGFTCVRRAHVAVAADRAAESATVLRKIHSHDEDKAGDPASSEP